MNKKTFSLLSILIISFLLTACGPKQTCSYCGNSKECTKFDVLGTERYICQDCIKNADIVSNNVIAEYKCDDIDSFYLPSKETENDQESEATDDTENAETSNSSVDVAASSISADSLLSNLDLAQPGNSNYRTKSDVISTLSGLLSSNGLTLTETGDNDNNYKILNSSGNDSNIHLTFSKNQQGNLTLSIEALEGYSSSDFTNTCISSALAFLESTDISGTGYNVYNNTLMHGNYTLNGCRFYYLEDSYLNSENITVVATFDISFQ